MQVIKRMYKNCKLLTDKGGDFCTARVSEHYHIMFSLCDRQADMTYFLLGKTIYCIFLSTALSYS